MPALVPPIGRSLVAITAQNQFSEPLYIRGGFGVSIDAGLTGTVTIQRDPMYDGSSLTGFKDVVSFTAATERSFSESAGAFYRIGCKTGNFTAGSTTAFLWITNTGAMPGKDPGEGGGDASAANQTTLNTEIGATNEAAAATDTSTSGLNGLLKRIAQRLTTLITNCGTLVFGPGVAAAAQRMTLASDDPAVAALGATSGAKVNTDAAGTIQQYLRGLVYRPATGTQSSVAAAAADTSLLASNANRMGATIYNDSASILYLLAATGTASATVKTLDVQPNGYVEIPRGYTGQIRGFWVTATGNARITEYT